MRKSSAPRKLRRELRCLRIICRRVLELSHTSLANEPEEKRSRVWNCRICNDNKNTKKMAKNSICRVIWDKDFRLSEMALAVPLCEQCASPTGP